MNIRWRMNARALLLPQNGNKYFGGYEICATGIRNFVAADGISFLAECNNADSELAKQMKEQLSCIIGATHTRAAVTYLRTQLNDDISDRGRPWTKFAHAQKGICTFGRKGTNNPVEQTHSKQVPERHYEPNRFLRAWVESERDKENVIFEAADKLIGKILSPWAGIIFEINHDAMRTCRIGNRNVTLPERRIGTTSEHISNLTISAINFEIKINQLQKFSTLLN
ncbi:unnamed protein product [Bathycoccus prasinos]